MPSENIVRKLLLSAGVTIGGNRPWDITVKNERFYGRVLHGGNLGLGESYMDGWWEVPRLDEFFYRITRSGLSSVGSRNIPFLVSALRGKIFNLQTRVRARKVAREHYDIGNDLYLSFLDPYNQYTCAYFKDTDDLNTAQERKLDLICRKLTLSSADRVLDIGCGWGGFAKFAAERYGCHVTGITISDEQVAYARDYCRGLPVTIIKSDYRDVRGSFDKVLTCGMIEHVGYKNYRTFMETVRRLLKEDGLFLLHTIGNVLSERTADPWITRYIFPNSMLPSVAQIGTAIEGFFVMEDWHNFGTHYYKTLMAWFKNFSGHWEKLKDKYGDRFYRMWKYYLLSCAGAFRSRHLELWQIILSPKGVAGGYEPVR